MQQHNNTTTHWGLFWLHNPLYPTHTQREEFDSLDGLDRKRRGRKGLEVEKKTNANLGELFAPPTNRSQLNQCLYVHRIKVDDAAKGHHRTIQISLLLRKDTCNHKAQSQCGQGLFFTCACVHIFAADECMDTVVCTCVFVGLCMYVCVYVKMCVGGSLVSLVCVCVCDASTGPKVLKHVTQVIETKSIEVE